MLTLLNSCLKNSYLEKYISYTYFLKIVLHHKIKCPSTLNFLNFFLMLNASSLTCLAFYLDLLVKNTAQRNILQFTIHKLQYLIIIKNGLTKIK